MTMQKVLIVGASRGIGLEMARQLCDRGDDVTITCRTPPPDVESLSLRCIDGLDVTDDDAVSMLANTLAGTTFDMIIHNAGILSKETLDDLDFDRIRQQFEVNTLAPLRVASALKDNLATGSKLGIVTSRMGSIEDKRFGRHVRLSDFQGRCKYGWQVPVPGPGRAWRGGLVAPSRSGRHEDDRRQRNRSGRRCKGARRTDG